jgi:hypothetical protein
MKGLRTAVPATLALAVAAVAMAQQLEPRAYSPAPVGTNFLGLALLDSRGGVLTDPSLPLTDVSAQLDAVSPYYGRTFALAGRSASFTMVVPFAWATAEGLVFEERQAVDRTGLADPTLRFAVNLLGGPAMTPQEFRARTRRPTLGASLVVSCPFGEYFPDKLINLGTNRWAFKPELGLSFPAGRWDLELYGGVWLFTANDEFYGGVRREQDPLETAQTHVVYTFGPGTWAAADFTYYWGGETTIDGVPKNDRQSNTRGGLTFAMQVLRGQSLKLTWARGVSTRIGSSFQTFGVAWQWVWIDRARPSGSS